MFQRRLFALAAMLGLSADVSLRAPSVELDRIERGLDPRGKSFGYKQHKDRKPPRDADGRRTDYRNGFDERGKIGQRNKVSSCARRANRYGLQKGWNPVKGHVSFISYAEQDRQTRDDMVASQAWLRNRAAA